VICSGSSFVDADDVRALHVVPGAHCEGYAAGAGR